ncbi:MAG: tRNA (adenosine(37)-N6)-threonylcarbamoyltransferase complex dimerization subunit type 1 TsaB [Rikenellaceae bacterium]
MAKILSIECGTAVCSVGLGIDGALVSLRESDATRNHASDLAMYIEEVLDENQIRSGELDAVAVGSGPGSYTGLRIGSSTAKGLAYSLGKPLIVVDSLLALATLATQEYNAGILSIADPSTALIVPMIDARRMEVYTSVFNLKLQRLEPTRAVVVDSDFLSFERERSEIILLGDGGEKCYDMLSQYSENIRFTKIYSSARGMVALAQQQFMAGDFVDTAYWEPFYLKDFVATQSKKKFF